MSSANDTGLRPRGHSARPTPRRPTTARPTTVRHGRQKSSHPVATIAKVLAAALAVILVSAGSVAAFAAWDVASGSKPGIHLTHLDGTTKDAVPDIAAIEGGVNLLLTGTDTRTGQGGAFGTKDELAGSSGIGNNDVNMLMHISEDHHSVTVISFPRDLMVAVPACPRSTGGNYPASSKVMLNSTLARGGLPCVVLTVEKLTGLQIPFAAVITLDGVIAMSNAVGGVTVCLATAVNETYTIPQLHLAAGEQTLVGAEALSFLRSRHGVGDGSDLGRISNQQVFLSALARKVMSGDVLANPLKLYALAKAAVSNVNLSDTLTNPTTLVSIALALKDAGLSNMVFLQYPTTADPANQNRVVPQSYAASILNAALVADQPIQLSGKPGRAAVVDPNAAVVPTSPTTVDPTADPTTPADGAAAVVLPSTVTGQTAAEQTCTKGR